MAHSPRISLARLPGRRQTGAVHPHPQATAQTGKAVTVTDTPRVKRVVHVMTRRRVFPSGAGEWRCSTCAHEEVIGTSGARVVTVTGLETVPHGLLVQDHEDLQDWNQFVKDLRYYFVVKG